MARLQILPLPEGAGDDRPPYLLVVDQLPTGDEKYDALRRDLLDNDITSRTGARAALCFEGTIELPANDPLPLPEVDDVSEADFTTMATAVRRALGIDITEGEPDIAGWLLTACRELEKSEAARAQLRGERDRANEALARVRDLPERPEAMAANPEHPYATWDGYAQGIRTAKLAARTDLPQTAEYGG